MCRLVGFWARLCARALGWTVGWGSALRAPQSSAATWDSCKASIWKAPVVTVQIKSVHARYEDPDAGNSFALGVMFEDLSCVSTDLNWNPTFLTVCPLPTAGAKREREVVEGCRVRAAARCRVEACLACCGRLLRSFEGVTGC